MRKLSKNSEKVPKSLRSLKSPIEEKTHYARPHGCHGGSLILKISYLKLFSRNLPHNSIVRIAND